MRQLEFNKVASQGFEHHTNGRVVATTRDFNNSATPEIPADPTTKPDTTRGMGF